MVRLQSLLGPPCWGVSCCAVVGLLHGQDCCAAREYSLTVLLQPATTTAAGAQHYTSKRKVEIEMGRVHVFALCLEASSITAGGWGARARGRAAKLKDRAT